MQYKCIMCYSTSLLPTDTQLVVVVVHACMVAVAHNYSAVYTSAYGEHAMWLGGKPKVQENG